MQIPFRQLSIRKKIITFMMGIAGVIILLFYVITVKYQINTARRNAVDNLSAFTDVLLSMSNLQSADATHEWTSTIQKGLQDEKNFETATIFSLDGTVLATYHNPDLPSGKNNPVTFEDRGSQFFFRDGSPKLGVFQPILLKGRRLGTLYVLLRLPHLKDQLERSVLYLMLVMMSALLFIIAVSVRLQRLVTAPVSALATTARKITESGDYRIRLEKNSEDEIGDLIDNFNTMLDVIGQRDAEISNHKHHLEMLVKERTEQLRLKRDEALAAAEAKSEFLANMSHEIRTPMNGIIGVLSLLKDAPLNEEYRRLMHTAARSADSLLLIINDILDFSKIEAGKLDFESIVFDLRDLMEEVALLFMEAARMKQIDLFCFIPTNIETRVYGDPTRLRQILTNLLSNAIKFTDKGEVVLKVELGEKQDERVLLRFSVEDTGIGISSEAMKGLFTKFTQADGSTTRKYGGTGLGLSVCKQLVEKQNGEIGVESEDGKGTVFWFTLPLKPADTTIPKTSYKILNGRRFLLVDDNATNRLIIEHYLKAGEALIHSCDRGDQALTVIKEMTDRGKPFDTVLLDYNMPGKDGIQVAEEILELFGDKAPELVLLGSEGTVREKALAAGIQTIVYKPIRLDQFYNALRVRAKSEAEPFGEGEGQKQLPPLRGEVLLVDDELINRKVGRAILKKAGIVPDVANNGREALQMIAEKGYDLILMDIQMPELSGFDTTEIIRNNESRQGLPRVPIIALTANAMESTRQYSLSIGMDDFIAKPIQPEAMIELLKPWLSTEYSAGRAKGKKPPSLSGPSNSDPQKGESLSINGKIWDEKKALQLVSNDEPLLKEMAALFLERNTILLQDVAQAVSAKDAPALHDAAHAYKGAVNHFAAPFVQELALALELKGRDGDLNGIETLFDRLCESGKILLEELRVYTAEGDD